MKCNFGIKMLAAITSAVLIFGCSENQDSASNPSIKPGNITLVAKSAESFNSWSWLNGQTLGCALPGNSFKLFEFGDKSVVILHEDGQEVFEMKKPSNGFGFLLENTKKSILFSPEKGKYEGVSVVAEFSDSGNESFLCYHLEDQTLVPSDGSFDTDAFQGHWECEGDFNQIDFNSKLNFSMNGEVGTLVLVGSKSFGQKMDGHFLYHALSNSFVKKIVVFPLDISKVSDSQISFGNTNCKKVM